MEELEYLKRLLEQKEVHTELDQKRIDNLKVILNDEKAFFKLDMNTAIGILLFLGIKEDEVINYYNKLTSSTAFKEANESYITISSKK